MDVLLNFGTSALSDDNLITQLKLAGKILIFFGDDTWLNLFPDHFAGVMEQSHSLSQTLLR